MQWGVGQFGGALEATVISHPAHPLTQLPPTLSIIRTQAAAILYRIQCPQSLFSWIVVVLS